MDTILLILVIIGIGYYFSTIRNKTSENIRNIASLDSEPNSMPDIEKPVSLNIYNSNMIETANNDVLKLSLKKYNESSIPSVSSVLPPIYNSYSAIGNESILHNNTLDLSSQELAGVDYVNKRSDINTENQGSVVDRPMFKQLLNMNNPQSDLTFTNFGSGPFTNQETSLLSGLPLEKEHINQVPFFGSNVKQNIEEFTNEARLDNYTGNTSVFFHKKEPIQRFDKVPEYNINGTTKTPNLADNIDMTRFIPSRFKQNEKPFYEERIEAPISFTADNPITKAQINQPTIDSLRVVTKNQISYPGRIKAGSNIVPTRPTIGAISKNSIDSSFELGEKRLFTGPGAVIAPMTNKNFDNILPTTRQSQNIEYIGSAVNKNGSIQRTIIDNSHELN